MRDVILIVRLKTLRLLAEPRWENKVFFRLLLFSHHNRILSHFCSHRNYSEANIMRIKPWIRFVSVAVLKEGKRPLLSCHVYTWYGYKVHHFISQFVKRLYNTTRECLPKYHKLLLSKLLPFLIMWHRVKIFHFKSNFWSFQSFLIKISCLKEMRKETR